MSSKEIYQNFDFGRNWEEKCLPHILKIKGNTAVFTPGFKRVFKNIKKKHIKFCEYPDQDVPPVELSTNDAFHILTEEIMLYFREQPELLTKAENHLLDAADEIDLDGMQNRENECENDEYMFKILTILDEMILKRNGLVWDEKNKSHLAFYIPFGDCFLWNKYFGLWLAKKVCPEEKWVVRESENHCTIISIESKKIFDILYWSLDYRLKEYCYSKFNGDCSDEIGKDRSRDKSLGGNLAYRNSTPK